MIGRTVACMPAQSSLLIAWSLAQRVRAPRGLNGGGGGGGADVAFIAGVILGLIALVIICGFIIVRLGKQARAGAEDAEGMSLDDLRAMKARGGLTTEEYQTIKQALAQKTIAQLDAKAARRDPHRAAGVSVPPRPERNVIERDNTKTAQPGFDLKGDPLPKTRQAE